MMVYEAMSLMMTYMNNEIYDGIQRVIYQSWNPLYTTNFSQSSDTYHSYVPIIYDMLANISPPEKLYRYLYNVEKVLVKGYEPDQKRIQQTVDRLIGMYNQIQQYYARSP